MSGSSGNDDRWLNADWRRAQYDRDTYDYVEAFLTLNGIRTFTFYSKDEPIVEGYGKPEELDLPDLLHNWVIFMRHNGWGVLWQGQSGAVFRRHRYG
jgi:hypothetical protein